MTIASSEIYNISSFYPSLLNELNFLELQIKIYNSWQFTSGFNIGQMVNSTELLMLHGYDKNYTIIRSRDHYQIYQNNEIILEFLYCNHYYYTPIKRGKDNEFHIQTQCLRC